MIPKVLDVIGPAAIGFAIFGWTFSPWLSVAGIIGTVVTIYFRRKYE